jgi:hypothetical protein
MWSTWAHARENENAKQKTNNNSDPLHRLIARLRRTRKMTRLLTSTRIVAPNAALRKSLHHLKPWILKLETRNSKLRTPNSPCIGTADIHIRFFS